MQSIEINLPNRKKIIGYLNPLSDELIEIASLWRFVVFGTGDIFCADAAEATHADICTLSLTKDLCLEKGYGLTIGYFKLEQDKILFGVIQHNDTIDRKIGFRFLQNLIPAENLANGRQMELMTSRYEE